MILNIYITLNNILKIFVLIMIVHNYCCAMNSQNKLFTNNIKESNNKILSDCIIHNNTLINNHNNKYEPNTIYTSTQYLIDTDPILIQDEKKIMQLSKDLCNSKSQNSIVFNFSINQSIANILKQNRKIIFIDEFRSIIDSLIKCNIGGLPERAEEVNNFNKVLTKITLNALLNKVIGNNINIKEHNILLMKDKNDNINSIFGKNYNSNIKELNTIKYKNKKCSFKITSKNNASYYTVVLQ